MLVNYADSDAGSSSDGGEGGSAAAVSADDAFGLKELEQQRTSKPEGSQQGTSASATASAALSSAPAVFSHVRSQSKTSPVSLSSLTLLPAMHRT